VSLVGSLPARPSLYLPAGRFVCVHVLTGEPRTLQGVRRMESMFPLRRSGTNNSAMFAEIVPEQLRSAVYAFDRSFEGAIGATGAPLVGEHPISAQSLASSSLFFMLLRSAPCCAAVRESERLPSMVMLLRLY
jgi:hypothetical protein